MTFKKLAVLVSGVALVAVLGVLAVVPAFAQSSTPPAQSTPALPAAPGNGLGAGRGFGLFGGGSWTEFDAEAKALSLTPTQLFEQLHSGKSVSEIAQAQGVDLQTVQDAVKAVETQAMKDNINQAVKDGTMSQAQADWLLQGIEKGYTMGGGPGFGRGGRHGGLPGGPRSFGGQAPSAAPTATPGSQS